jgi:hypothetical protein
VKCPWNRLEVKQIAELVGLQGTLDQIDCGDRIGDDAADDDAEF